MADEEPPPPPKTLTWDEILALFADGAGQEPNICMLYKAIFGIRVAAPSPVAAVTQLVRAVAMREDGSSEGPPHFSSMLFRHECCYLLGQIGADAADIEASRLAYDCLLKVLLDKDEDEVTRHEAAEGIAAVQSAIGSGGSSIGGSVGNADAEEMLRLLERFSQEQDGKGPLAETCYLAVEGIKRKGAKKVCACQYASHDPAIGDPNAGPEDVERYRTILETTSNDLFERYVAMFTLRNLGACDVLAAVLDSDQSSCVLRHELAFVLGQMENDVAVAALMRNLGTAAEHVMVRHEAAIALGSIGGETAKVKLREYAADVEPMVAESCQVALDTAAYWEAWEALEARLGSS